MQPIRLGLVGYGKIAQDQHVPAINANPAFQLVSVATQGKPCAGVENFQSLSELLANGHVERAEFMRLLGKFVQLNNAQSRAPLRSDRVSGPAA